MPSSAPCTNICSSRLRVASTRAFDWALSAAATAFLSRCEAIADSEAATARGTRLHLRLAIDYSAREAIFHAASRFYKATELSTESFSNVLAEVHRGGAMEVDLLIRTGGEQRLSDFLLWECAFAEFVFLSKRWPDFTPGDLQAAVLEFGKRERTRGALPDAIAG
jgi:undecaprenyl diphosphate synthase